MRLKSKQIELIPISRITSSFIESRVLITNSDGKIDQSTITAEVLNYLVGLSSNAQDQLNNKIPLIWTDILNETTTLLSDELLINRSNSLSKTTVASLLANVDKEIFIVVTNLPAVGIANKIYLKPSTLTETGDSLEEWVYVDGGWEKLGSITIDIDNYYNKSEIDLMISPITSSITSLSNNKQDNITGAASTITSNNLVEDRVVISGTTGKIEVSTVTKNELLSLSGISSNIQDQLNAKVNIYNANGTIDSNRTVNLEQKKITFTYYDNVDLINKDLLIIDGADKSLKYGNTAFKTPLTEKVTISEVSTVLFVFDTTPFFVYEKQRLDHNQNMGWGFGETIRIGTGAGQGSVGQGMHIFIGISAGSNYSGNFGTQSHNSVMIGRFTGRNFGGLRNVGVGGDALDGATYMNQAVAIGQGAAAGVTNTTATNNVGNVFIGETAGYAANGPSNVVFIGAQAGRQATGTHNVYIGAYNGFGVSGSGNIFIGNRNTGSGGTAVSNSISIGDVRNTASNQVNLGNSTTVDFNIYGTNVILKGNLNFPLLGTDATGKIISKTQRGVIEKKTSTERLTLTGLVQGDMVYQTNEGKGLYYYENSAWFYNGTPIEFKEISGTTYTLTNLDIGYELFTTNANDVVITVPSGVFKKGHSFYITQRGLGKFSIAVAAGLELVFPNTFGNESYEMNAIVRLKFITDTIVRLDGLTT